MSPESCNNLSQIFEQGTIKCKCSRMTLMSGLEYVIYMLYSSTS